MTRTTKLWAATVGLLGLGLIVLALLYRHERGAHFDASLRADSALAAADTSKRVTDAKVQKVLGDSTAAWQRRTVQETQRADSLDKVLGSERKTLTDLRVSINKGTGSASGAVRVVYVPVNAGTPGTPVAESTSIRSSHFDVTAGVFQVAADVSLPAPPARGTMEATVTAPQIPLGIRIECGSVTDGVRRADAIVTGPTWATVGIARTEASPAVCNPTMKIESGRRVPLWVMVTTDVLSAVGGYWLGSKSQHLTVVTK